MDKVLKEIKLSETVVDYIERLWYEYVSRKDIIESLFEDHKFDKDATVLESMPFKHYESKFQESKIAYELAMEEIKNNEVPEEYRTSAYRFEVRFSEKVLLIYKA